MDPTDCWSGYATICRLCLQKDGFMLGIFNHIRGKERSIYKKIMDCTDIQIASGDGLPTCICHRCLYKIELCIEFKQQCFISDATLRQFAGLPSKPLEEANIPLPNIPEEPEDVVMVVDPQVVDYDSEYDSDNEVQSDVESPELNDLADFRNVFMCKFCDQAFTNRPDCTAHEGSAHNQAVPYMCNECEMGFADRTQYCAHLKSVHQNDKPYNCPQCQRTFARRSDLRKHTIVHTGIKPYTCSICFKSFSRNTNLSKHMRIHSGQKPFVCMKCPKTFTSKAELTRHAVVHSGKKPFVCGYCSLSFSRRDKLLRHEKRHFPQENVEDNSQELELMRHNLSMDNSSMEQKPDGEGISPDNEKQDGWTSSENVVINVDPFNHDTYEPLESSSHSDVVNPVDEDQQPNNIDYPRVPEHLEADEGKESLPHGHVTADSSVANNSKTVNSTKRYPCLTCQKRFSNLEGLYMHMAAHSENRPFNCNICSKSFLRKRELDRHMTTHSGMKPFRCDNCDKRFGRKDKLMRHMRIHDGVQKHSCVVCNATFNRKESLVHHLRSHKNDKSEVLVE